VARFGPDEEILHWLEQGELDLAVTSTASPRRSLEAQPLAHKPFVLVAAAGDAPPVPLASLEAVGEWLRGRDWAAYSLELPITRRFWQQHLGHPFSANLRLVVPDLRAVVSAVARGVGCSILPTFVCAELLASGRIVEVHPVSHLIPPEQWYLCTRQGEAGRSGVAELAAMLLTPLR
jgi:DNA-binding transcriptional LysR family regulator